MHCLLCHEKISKIRHWRTKSEFCCDEHAAIHRRQTLERLVGYVAPSREDDHGLSVFGKPAGARGEECDAPPLPVDAFETAAPPRIGETANAAWDAVAEESSEEEFSLDAEWLQTGEEPADEATHEAEPAEDRSADADFGDEDEQDEELVAGQPEDDRPYFEAASVQRDEPFPVEIQTAEADPDGDERQIDLASREPIEPGASADASDAAALLELLSPGSPDALTSAEVLDDGSSLVTKLSEAKPEMAEELAQAILERESAAAPEAAIEQATGQDRGQSGEPETQPPSQTLQEAAQAEIAAEAGSAESPAAAIQEAADATAEPTKGAAGAEESAPRPKAAAPAKPAAKSFGLKPVKTWDPSRDRSAGKKRMGGRVGAGGAGNAEGLSQLAEGLGERGSKARPGLGSEIRREGGRKSVMVCFLPVQGGNGASTVSLHVAEAISHHLNERVLLSDFDFHSGTLAFRLGLKPAHTLGDVFEWSQNKEQLWEKVVCRWKKLDVLVAPPSNSSIHPHSLDRLPDIFVSALERYPYVIVDHPDAIYSSSRHILMLSDLVYLVCTPEITSLHLARRKVQQIRAMGVPGERLRLIVNRAGSWGSLGVQDVGKIVGVPVSWALNNDYAALRDAVWNGGLVQDGSELAKQLRELGWSVMGVDAPVAAESAVPAEVGSSAG
jgi:MinD-like ATPase involved in chromosome partitioning or flagellar assembly